MKGFLVVLSLLAVAPAWAAEAKSAAGSAPDLAPEMNGEYRCDGGIAFAVHVKAAPVVESDIQWQPAGVKAGKNFTESSGGYEPVNRDRITGTDFYGAIVRLDGKDHDLLRQDGKPLQLATKSGDLRWRITGTKPPYTGALYRYRKLLAGNCRLVEPESNTEPKK